MTKPDITPEAIARVWEEFEISTRSINTIDDIDIYDVDSLMDAGSDLKAIVDAQAERIAEMELGVATLRPENRALRTAFTTARNSALREAAHECEQVAYSGKYPQDDQSELGCLRCRDNILARIEGDTND